MENPAIMANGVFRRLRASRRPVTLKTFFKAVDAEVAAAYRAQAGQGTIMESLLRTSTSALRKSKATALDRARAVLANLPARDSLLLRHAFWDELTPAELAILNGGTPADQEVRLAGALQRLAAKLPAEFADDPAEAMRQLHPGDHRRN